MPLNFSMKIEKPLIQLHRLNMNLDDAFNNLRLLDRDGGIG